VGGDTQPDQFSVESVDQADWGVEVTSKEITIQGIDAPAPVLVSGGSYAIGAGPFTTATGKVVNGQTLRIRGKASIDPSGKAQVLVDVGGVSAMFLIQTKSQQRAADLRVGGANPTHSSLAAAVAALKAGQVLDVVGGTHGPVVFDVSGTGAKPIIVRGLPDSVTGRRPVISGAASNTTVLFNESNHVVLDNFEVTNGATKTGSCIRNVAHEITLRRLKVFGCANHGILGADDGGSLTLDQVEVTGAGCSPPRGMQCDGSSEKHPVYVATNQSIYPNAAFRVNDSYFHDNNAGETIKSRAQRVEIRYSWIESSGKGYRALGLYGYDGDTASLLKPIHHDIVGNVLIARDQASSVARFGGDGTGDTYGRTRLVNNTVLVDANVAATRPLIQLDFILEGFAAHNNVFSVLGGRTANQPVPPINRLILETGALEWAGGAPKLVMSNNYAPEGTTLLSFEGDPDRDVGFNNLPLPSSGRVMESWVRAATPGLSDDLNVAKPNPQLRPDSSLLQAGTLNTNRTEVFVPGALRQPLRNVMQLLPSGVPGLGSERKDVNATNPALGGVN
jgi:hypothetical protein